MRLALALAVTALSLVPSNLSAASAVAPRGVVSVVVTDTAGNPLPGVTITLVSSAPRGAQPRREVTTALGAASFEHLAQGIYTLRCELSGFFTTTLDEVPVELVQESPRLPSQIRIALTAGPIYY